ncbi:MAG: bifunctional chorismate mutase/prephenate dehydratase [bacterium]
MNERDLSALRAEIDQTDEALLSAFLKRMRLAGEIGDYKAARGLPIRDRSRERAILSRVSEKAGELGPYAWRLYATLFSLSRAHEAERKGAPAPSSAFLREALAAPDAPLPPDASVAVQGVEGAWSQAAAERLFPRGKLLFLRSFEAVFDAVEAGLCRYGVLPIENSTNGSVRAVYELLRTRRAHILRAHRQCIRHALLVKPGTRLEDVREIHSHEQALGQCSAFLRQLGDRVRAVPEANTALAAQLVAASADPGLACLASPACAELYGLTALETRVQNSDNNYTRFIVIGTEPRLVPGADRIAFVMALEHRPGALAEALSDLGARGVNLLKLESAPIVGSDFEFLFYCEAEADPRDVQTLALLEELERTSPLFRFLGAYR